MNSTNGQFLDQELAKFQATASSFANHFIIDAKVRIDYIAQTKKFSDELKLKVSRNHLTPAMAALQAQEMRNTILEVQRTKSTSLGLSIAEFLKKEGKILKELEQKYADSLFNKDFLLLSQEQKNSTWKKIVQKSGEPRVSASNGAKWLGRAGKGLFALTIAIAVYHIAQAENKTRAITNETVAVGGGIAGSTALGSAGLFCGPAAIACVSLGIFLGGVLGAAGADWAFDKIWE